MYFFYKAMAFSSLFAPRTNPKSFAGTKIAEARDFRSRESVSSGTKQPCCPRWHFIAWPLAESPRLQCPSLQPAEAISGRRLSFRECLRLGAAISAVKEGMNFRAAEKRSASSAARYTVLQLHTPL